MKIYFTEENKKQFFKYVDQIVSSNFWSEGKMCSLFEEECEKTFGLYSVAVSNGGTALSLLYDYAGIKGKEVIIPSNTAWPTIVTALNAGAKVVYGDCNKYDLCLSYEDVKNKITPDTVAVVVVHIGGYIAFDIDKIADLCASKGITLIEDCAHAHGAVWNGRYPGSWGIGGAYSFYSTKTLTTGEGGLLVTKNKDLADWAKNQRNYGRRFIDGKMVYFTKNGSNFRISEFTAALGRIQLENLKTIIEWKTNLAQKYDQIFERHVKLPDGMRSGFYKYIVFDYDLTMQTGKVFSRDDQGHVIEKSSVNLPNTDWVGLHHACPPIFTGWDYADKSVDELSELLIK
jgi:dTDP-4-amino-4,6-dideoxygalactose transaminase